MWVTLQLKKWNSFIQSGQVYKCVGKHSPGMVVALNMIHFCDATTFTTAACCAVV